MKVSTKGHKREVEKNNNNSTEPECRTDGGGRETSERLTDTHSCHFLAVKTRKKRKFPLARGQFLADLTTLKVRNPSCVNIQQAKRHFVSAVSIIATISRVAEIKKKSEVVKRVQEHVERIGRKKKSEISVNSVKA